MKKRVLIVSELFEPLNSIGSVRPSKLAKFLTKRGVDVTVFTSHKTKVDAEYVPNGFKLVYDQPIFNDTKDDSDGSVARSAHRSINEGLVASLRKELSLMHRQYLAYHAGKSFCINFLDRVDDGTIDITDFDCVFTTFGPIGPVLTGIQIKKSYPEIKWINDFRDPMVSQLMPSIAKPLYGKIQAQSVSLCDWATTVSEGYRVRIQSNDSVDKFCVIPNGYDLDDKPASHEEPSVSHEFSFSYVGALYEGKRDIGPLFKALRVIVDKGLLPLEKVVFHYAGKDSIYLIQQAQLYNMEGIIHNHGFMTRAECLQLQSNSQFLVLSTWNEKGEEGVFPGKFIEYMLMDKPIVSIVDGTLANAEVTETINKYHLGISYESAAPQTEQQLYEWLKQQAIQFNEGKPPIFNPDREAISQTYDWEHIVERFCELIDG